MIDKDSDKAAEFLLLFCWNARRNSDQHQVTRSTASRAHVHPQWCSPMHLKFINVTRTLIGALNQNQAHIFRFLSASPFSSL